MAAVHKTEAGKKNADVYDPGSGVTPMDALTIQRYLMGIHTVCRFIGIPDCTSDYKNYRHFL
jgi:hypothetical protein